MNYDQVVSHFGTLRDAAYKLGFTEQALRNWKETGIPVRTQWIIQGLTKKKLRVDEAAESKG